jgi:DNA-binding CsgD family transcriptional regulator
MYDESIHLARSSPEAGRMFPPTPLATPLPNPAAWPGTERRRMSPHATHSALPSILNEIDYGMFVLDGSPKVLFANRAALAQLQAAEALVLEGGELAAADPRDACALNAAIRAAAQQRLRRMVMVGHPAHRMAVAVIPLPQSLAANQTHVLVMLSRREICEALSVHGFARDHGLSGAERRVLDALCQGLQANEIAAVQGVAISTVRTQISSIRAKTDSASIGEVVQRLARLPPIRSSLLAEARLERQPLASCR